MLLFSLANLDEEQLEALQAWEAKTGKRLLAFSVLPVGFDLLDHTELQGLQDLEAKLGVTLVAVQ